MEVIIPKISMIMILLPRVAVVEAFTLMISTVSIRAVESESLKVGKSLKIGKNRIKSEKSDLISY